jgi:hypothetical protein
MLIFGNLIQNTDKWQYSGLKRVFPRLTQHKLAMDLALFLGDGKKKLTVM